MSIKEMKLRAHAAACKYVSSMEYSDRSRSDKLNMLTDGGFARCLLDIDKESGTVELRPLCKGTSKPEHGESWTHWALYSLAEVKEYLKLTGANDPWENPPEYKEGDPCPSCGGHCSYRTERNAFRCQSCGDMWDTQDCQVQDIGASLTGFFASYSGPGRAFNHEPFAKVVRGRLLVTINGGYDI
jgi:hypothetical protein